MKIQAETKFNFGDQVYYLERNWYLEEAVVHYIDRYTSHKPFVISSVKVVKTKELWSTEVKEEVLYDLCFIEGNKIA